MGDVEECLELDRSESTEGFLAASAVVGRLDPADDRDAEFGAGGPAAAVEDVLLQETEEGLRGGVVGAGPDPAHRAPARPNTEQSGSDGPNGSCGWMGRVATPRAGRRCPWRRRYRGKRSVWASSSTVSSTRARRVTVYSNWRSIDAADSPATSTDLISSESPATVRNG